MNYTDVTELTSVKKLEKLLKNSDIEDFTVYVGYADAVYAVTEIDAEDDYVYVNSEETYGSGSQMIVSDFLMLLESECYDDSLDIICTAPDDIDPELDCQMTEDMELYAVAVDDINCDVILLVK